MAEYQTWIAAHQPVNPRGQCAAMTARMVSVFPELRRVRGFYVCPREGRRPHWWLVAPSGAIVDPTVEQFASCGMGDYEPYEGPEPTGQCLNCGALVFGSDPFCDARCACEVAVYCAAGGQIIVNGQRVWPEPSADA